MTDAHFHSSLPQSLPQSLPHNLQALLQDILGTHRSQPGALLPVLHAVQDACGHIPEAAVPIIARELNLSRAEVHGVLTYYQHFRQQAGGRHILRVCCSEACQALGSEALLAHVRARLACDFGETTADGAISLEPVYCLGHCAVGPNLLVEPDQLHGRMDAEKFDRLVATLREPS